MADMQFGEDQTNEFGRPPAPAGGGGMADKLIKWGIASNQQQAQYVLIGIAVVALVLAFFVYRNY